MTSASAVVEIKQLLKMLNYLN